MVPPEVVGPRLADFIDQNREAIMADWENFARAHWPGEVPGAMELRDNASAMLSAVVKDLRTRESEGEQKLGSEGGDKVDPSLEGAAMLHARERISSGFDIVQVVAELRALRASVMRIWQASHPAPHAGQVDDLIRFSDLIDQLMAISVEAHSAHLEPGRRFFMRVIGHDLRQPLCSVRLLVSALIRAGDTIETAPVLAKIQQSVDSIDALVRDLVDLSCTMPGVKMAVYPQSLDLAELAGEALIHAESGNPRRSFKLVSVGDLSGEWDSLRLRQVLANLLGIAAEHGCDATPVELILHPTVNDEGVEIRVRSQGRQIPKGVLEMIFEPLKQYPQGEGHSWPGSMVLGLCICREIVRAHEGVMEVASTPEGITTFTIILPRTALMNGPGNKTERPSI
jgi:signal transduction histidine kinase